jgi:hypothetical protein
MMKVPLIVISIFVLVGAGVLLAQRNQSQITLPDTSSNSEPSAVDAKNDRLEKPFAFKTYQGESFSFQYPETWSLKDGELITSRATEKVATGDVTPGWAYITIVLSGSSSEELIQQTPGIEGKQQVTAGGKKAVKLNGHSGIAGSVYFEKVIIEKGNQRLILTLVTQDEDLRPTFSSEFNQMLSTVQFR